MRARAPERECAFENTASSDKSAEGLAKTRIAAPGQTRRAGTKTDEPGDEFTDQ